MGKVGLANVAQGAEAPPGWAGWRRCVVVGQQGRLAVVISLCQGLRSGNAEAGCCRAKARRSTRAQLQSQGLPSATGAQARGLWRKGPQGVVSERLRKRRRLSGASTAANAPPGGCARRPARRCAAGAPGASAGSADSGCGRGGGLRRPRSWKSRPGRCVSWLTVRSSSSSSTGPPGAALVRVCDAVALEEEPCSRGGQRRRAPAEPPAAALQVQAVQLGQALEGPLWEGRADSCWRG